MMFRRLLGALAVALMLAAPARATEQSSYVMPSTGPMSMTTFVATYLNPGVRALAACHNGSSAPANGPSSLPLAYQCWVDTTANPSLYKLYDGTSWITIGSINTSTHAWLPYLTAGVSGGVPFFSATNIIGSSALLTNHGVVVGGGAGAAPATISVGTNGQLLIGQTAANPAMTTVSGDLTINSSGVTVLGNVPDATPMAGRLLATAIAAPSTPAAGKGSIYVDSTSKNIAVKDDAGVVKHGVQTRTATSNQFVTAISDAGVVSQAQPAVTDLSGFGTGVATFLGTPSSANLLAALTDETGTGAAVFAGSPALTGAPTAPTAANGTNTTQLATTQFVQTAVVASTTGVSSIAGNTGAFTLGNGIDNSTNLIQLTAARRTLPTKQVFLSGSGTYTTPSNVLWIELTLIGGGGGGGGGNGSGTTNGAATCWNTSGSACTTPVYSAGGATGSAGGVIAGSGSCDWSVVGGTGSGAVNSISGSLSGLGGTGGNGSLGGAGAGVTAGGGGNAAANSGAGGAGGATTTAATLSGGSGGGAGATCHVIINSPAASYTYAIGTGGTGSAGGANGFAGGNGAAGQLFVLEHYGS